MFSGLNTLLWLTVRSLRARRTTAMLALLSIAVSVALVLTVERVRADAKASFTNTISGADLIVGGRSSPLNLLLYSIFRLGDATNGMRWDSYRYLATQPEVLWTIPLALGDAHKGFRVLGTTGTYFEHYRYADQQPLVFTAGEPFKDAGGAVLGAEVAAKLNYALGSELIVSHGVGAVSFQQHSDQPLHVTGILARTGTPVDRTVHVSLGAIDAMHGGAAGGAHDHDPEENHDAQNAHSEHEGQAHGDHQAHDEHPDHEADEHDAHEQEEHEHEEHGAREEHEEHAPDTQADDAQADGADAHHEDHEHDEPDSADEHQSTGHAEDTPIEAITAAIVGVKNKGALFGLQRRINEYEAEALLAAIPGVTLQQLWQLLGVAEVALFGISACVVFAGLVGLLTTLLTSLNERRRELAVLRSVGAGPGWVFALLSAEAALIGAGAALAGTAAAYGGLSLARSWVLERFGLALSASTPGTFDLQVGAAVTVASALVALLPAWRLYRHSLADGLKIRS